MAVINLCARVIETRPILLCGVRMSMFFHCFALCTVFTDSHGKQEKKENNVALLIIAYLYLDMHT